MIFCIAMKCGQTIAGYFNNYQTFYRSVTSKLTLFWTEKNVGVLTIYMYVQNVIIMSLFLSTLTLCMYKNRKSEMSLRPQSHLAETVLFRLAPVLKTIFHQCAMI